MQKKYNRKNMKKRKYLSPECAIIAVRTEVLLVGSSSFEEIPVDPDTPAPPAVREDPKSHGSLWDQTW